MTRKKISTPNFDSIQPRECINGKLRRLHRLLNSAYESKFRSYGLRGSMLSILFMVGKNPGINQKTIADAFVLDQSTMSRDLKRLSDKGWLEINKGEDARHSELALTKAGYELVEELSPIWQQTHETVARILGTYNVQQLDVVMHAIREHFQEIND